MRLYDPLEKIAKILNVDHFAERGTNNGWNYVKYASGYIDAWTTVRFAANENSKVIMLPTAMVDTNYNVMVTPHENGSVIARFWVANLNGNAAKTTSQFSISIDRTSNYAVWVQLHLHGKYK